MSTETEKKEETENLASLSVEEKADGDSEELQVYEIGFHLLPSIPEEKLPEEVYAIKEVIEKNGGLFVSEDFPKQKVLTYKIYKKIGGQNKGFDTAYFGWIKFEINPSLISEIKSKIDSNDNLLRYLLVKTVKENTMFSPQSKNSTLKDESSEEEDADSGDNNSEDGESSEPVSEEEIDKGIDKLVGEE
jgi:ribosomal protein S6